MHIKTALINWHNKAPVYACDFHKSSSRLATCGADKDVKIWLVNKPSTVDARETTGPEQSVKSGEPIIQGDAMDVENEGVGAPSIEFLSSLNRHRDSVNVVRFSPDGQTLASGGDDGVINLWRLDTSGDTNPEFGADEDIELKEKWKVYKSFRAHYSEIYDISWSPCGTHLATGSIDNSASVWTAGGRCVQQLKDHLHYVQGVAWDPRDKFILTGSSDQTVRVYSWEHETVTGNKGKGKKVWRQNEIIAKRSYKQTHDNTPSSPKATSAATTDGDDRTPMLCDASSEDIVQRLVAQVLTAVVTGASIPAAPIKRAPRVPRRHKMFQDESTATFFRRLSWSPDGSVIVIPTGQFKPDHTATAVSTAYAFVRNQFTEPVYHLPGFSKPVVAVRFSPVLYKLRTEASSPRPLIDLPYRMVYAVASIDSVAIYDTQHPHAIAMGTGIHYASITDLAWSADGTMLAVTSSDGYCSFAWFEETEIGDAIAKDDWPECMKPKTKGDKKKSQDSVSAKAGVVNILTARPNKRTTNTETNDTAAVNILQPRSNKPKTAATSTVAPADENTPVEATAPTVNILQPRSNKRPASEPVRDSGETEAKKPKVDVDTA